MLQTATSLKEVVDNWNIQTNLWLRYVCYERLRSRLPVFALSAFWHGFYGGYYVMFFTAAFFIETGRHVSIETERDVIVETGRHVSVETGRHLSVETGRHVSA